MSFRIGAFELDIETRQLRHEGRAIVLQPRVFDTLAYLAQNAPRVVGKDELLQNVWPGVTVTESSLQRVASMIRATLRVGGAERLLRSVPKVGYALEISGQAPVPPLPDTQLALSREVMAHPAICVLPLVVQDGDAAAGDLAEGLALDLIGGLSSWRLLPVISWFTARRYAGTGLAASEIAAECGARYLLYGRLQGSAGRFHLWFELIDAESGQQIWSDSLDVETASLPEIESHVSERVVAAVLPELERAELRRAMRRGPDDANAWELVVRARALIERADRKSLETAMELAERARERDPGFGMPYALIAFVRFQRAMMGWGIGEDVSYGDVFRSTLEAASAALDVDSGSWMAHALKGVGELWTNGNHAVAMRHLDQALVLNPSSSLCYHFAGCIAGFSGELEKAIYNQNQVFRLDPFYPYAAVVEADLGLWHMLEGDFDAAESWLERGRLRNPGYLRGLQRRLALGELTRSNSAASEFPDRPPAALSLESVNASYPFVRAEHRRMFVTAYERAVSRLGPPVAPKTPRQHEGQ